MNSCKCCSQTGVANANELVDLLKIVSEPNRLQILCILNGHGETCVCEFGAEMPDVSQSLMSHHLADLRKAGLVTSDKQGLRVYYSLTKSGREITETLLSLNNKGGVK